MARAVPWLLAALGVAAAILLWTLGPRVWIEFRFRPAAAVLTLALIAALVVWTIGRLRRWHTQTLNFAVQAARSEAEQNHRQFLSRLDHELKNPVTAIRAAIAAVDAERSGQLRTADEQAARLATVVGDLRKLSELRTGTLERESVDLVVLIEDAVSALRGELSVLGEQRDIRVHLPEAPWRIPAITADPDLLYIALHNLLANARKFSTNGDLIEVRASDTDGHVEIDVADTGCGIPEPDLPLVWEELARGTNARAVPGSGLGLSMVRTVVERHGGSVAIRSRPGEGTSVQMRLPV